MEQLDFMEMQPWMKLISSLLKEKKTTTATEKRCMNRD